MSVGEFVVAMLSTFVSVALYLFAERKTVGARQERVRSANDEIERILVRRIVQEDFDPGAAGLSRLIDAKARDSRVGSSDLLSEAQFMNNVYARIVESDLLPEENRRKIVDRLNATMADTETTSVADTAVEAAVSEAQSTPAVRYVLPLLGTLAATIGAGTFVLSEVGDLLTGVSQLKDVLTPALAIAGASASVMFVITLVSRLRGDPNEEPGRATSVDGRIEFEAKVARTLQKLRVDAKGRPSQAGYDFVVERSGEKILLEVKAWRRAPPPSVMRTTAERLREAVALEQASHAVVVVPKPMHEDRLGIGGEDVRFMSLTELRRHLAKRK